MKRLIGFIVILVLVALFSCCYFFNWFGNVGFFSGLYKNLTNFGGALKNKLSFLSSLEPKLVTVLFILCCFVVFAILYFVIFGLIAHAQKKKRAAKAKKDDETKEKEEVKKEVNQPAGMPANMNAFNPQAFQNGYVVSSSYSSTTHVQQEQLSEEEIEEEFHWTKFVGGKKIVRKIVTGILIVLGLIFLFLRFVWQLRKPDGSAGIGFLDPLFKTGFFKSMMGGLDDISNNVFRSYMPDPKDPGKNFVLGDVINGQSLYVQDVFEFLVIIFAVFLIVLIYLLITHWLCYLCRKPNAVKRANKAKAMYLEDVKNGTAPAIKRKNQGYGNTYITYFGQVVSGDNPVPYAPSQMGESETEIQTKEKEYVSPTKAELLVGGASFVGGDVSKIAELDTLDENAVQNEDSITYLESLGEGVKEVDEEKPYEEYEDLTSSEEDTVVVEEDVSSEPVEEELNLEDVDISTIRLSEGNEDELEDKEAREVIDFDEDGFAYRFEKDGEITVNENEGEELPSPVDLSLANDDSLLIANANELTLIEEPDFELISKVSILQPEFVVASSSGQVYYPNLEEERTPKEYEENKDSVYGEGEDIVIDRFVPRRKPDELVATEEQKELLKKIDPSPLVPVESEAWPREDTMIEDVGALRIYLDEGEKSVEFDRERKPNYLAPEIYELDEEETKQEPKEQPKGLRPLHDIHERKKIVPIAVVKEEEVVEEKEEIQISKPLHEITERSQRKDIKPVEINKNLRFNLKRFQTSTYRGNLTSEEAFRLGVTKVSPVVNPIVKGAANENEVPDWMKRIKEREARKQGVDSVKIKQAEDIGSVWDINTKEEVVKTVNDFSLRRKKKVEEEKVEEEKPVENERVVFKPKAPIKPIEVKHEKEEPETKVEKPVVKPLQPIHKINRSEGNKPKPIKPIRPITPISKKEENKDEE